MFSFGFTQQTYAVIHGAYRVKEQKSCLFMFYSK
jgi:hypothetical protein